MPLPIAHSLLGATAVAALHPSRDRGRLLAALAVGGALALVPDLDFLLVFGAGFDVHRGFTHSLFTAAALTCALAAFLGRGRLREAIAFGCAYGSHGLLDFAATQRASGVALLWPATEDRYQLGLLSLSEYALRHPWPEVLRLLAIELAIFAPVLAAVLAARWWATRNGRVGRPDVVGRLHDEER